MSNHTRGLQRAALTYALRDGWSYTERHDQRLLHEAADLFKELLGAYYGHPPEALVELYGDEYAAAQEGWDE